jgi:cysteine synthase A
MARLANNLCELIGDTPLLKLDRLAPDLAGRLLGKLEASNPGGSVKDRIGLAMIEAAEKDGRLKPGGTIIEPTSGNTGIGLALVAAVKGYRLIITMPESMSVERRKLLQGLGAEIVLTPADEGMLGAVSQAQEMLDEMEGAFMPQQFDNPANPDVHYRTTGPEIWEASGGKVDILVAGVGTAGTVSGAGKYLKEQNPNFKVVAVEPVESPVLSGGEMGPHMIQGIGAGFIPGNYDASVVDEVVQVSSDAAIKTAKQLPLKEGVLAGISAGANVCAAMEIARRPENADKTVVTIICDTGERYLSTLLFYED